MQAEREKIKFFKENIINIINDMKPYISNLKYKLYISMVDDCDSLSDIREMAEMDMQLNMIQYVKDIDDKLKLFNTSIDELEAITNQSNRNLKLSIIKPKKIEPKTNFEKANDIDFSSLNEDLEDEEMLASVANLLMLRINNTPAEELIDYDSLEDEESDEDLIEQIELDENNDNYYEEDDLEDDEDFEFEEDNLEEEDEEDDDDEIIDFGTSEDNNENDSEDTDWDSLGDDLFVDSDEDEFEDSFDFDEDDIDSLGDDLFVDSDEDEFEDEDDIDSLGDDLFVDSDEDEFEEDDFEEDEDIDSLGDDFFEDTEDDMFDSESEYDDEDDFDSIDSLGDDMFENSDDDFESDFEDESNNIDDIDADDLFSDVSDDDFEEDDVDDDEFDIDESDFEFEEPDEEEDTNEFDNYFTNKSEKNNTNKPVTRNREAKHIFVDGTKRGNQTQQMFNIMLGMFDFTDKTVRKGIDFTKQKVKK